MGMIFPMLALPGLCLAFVLWAAVSRRWSIGMQRATMALREFASEPSRRIIPTLNFVGQYRMTNEGGLTVTIVVPAVLPAPAGA